MLYTIMFIIFCTASFFLNYKFIFIFILSIKNIFLLFLKCMFIFMSYNFSFFLKRDKFLFILYHILYFKRKVMHKLFFLFKWYLEILCDLLSKLYYNHYGWMLNDATQSTSSDLINLNLIQPTWVQSKFSKMRLSWFCVSTLIYRLHCIKFGLIVS